MKQENTLVITAEWLKEAGCIKDDLSIDTEKLDKLMAGKSYIIDEVSFLTQNEKFVALDEAHVLAPYPFKLSDSSKKGEEQ